MINTDPTCLALGEIQDHLNRQDIHGHIKREHPRWDRALDCAVQALTAAETFGATLEAGCMDVDRANQGENHV